jgi:hypothetical protein
MTLSIPAQTFAGDPGGDVFSLARHAVGGSGWTGAWTTTSSGQPPFATIYDQQGTPGALAQSGANGAAGATSKVTHDLLSVSGENVPLNLCGTAADVIRLAGFGPTLDSFADVLAATTATAQGALIQTSATSSVLLVGLTVASLQADDFPFS